MSTCTHLSDRMPAVALGRAQWTAAEAGHLAACAACAAEWELVRAASRLGEGLAAPADAAVISARLMQRLARERALTRSRARRWTGVGLAAAAAMALAVWMGRQGGEDAARRSPIAAAPVAPPEPSLAAVPPAGHPGLTLPELDDLPEEALDSLLRVLDQPLAQADAYELPALGASGDRELERALTGLEG